MRRHDPTQRSSSVMTRVEQKKMESLKYTGVPWVFVDTNDTHHYTRRRKLGEAGPMTRSQNVLPTPPPGLTFSDSSPLEFTDDDVEVINESLRGHRRPREQRGRVRVTQSMSSITTLSQSPRLLTGATLEFGSRKKRRPRPEDFPVDDENLVSPRGDDDVDRLFAEDEEEAPEPRSEHSFDVSTDSETVAELIMQELNEKHPIRVEPRVGPARFEYTEDGNEVAECHARGKRRLLNLTDKYSPLSRQATASEQTRSKMERELSKASSEMRGTASGSRFKQFVEDAGEGVPSIIAEMTFHDGSQ